jgi:hypothetical protein
MTAMPSTRPADSFDRTLSVLLVLSVSLFCAGIIGLVLFLRAHGVLL